MAESRGKVNVEPGFSLSVSLVIYRSDEILLSQTLASLGRAVNALKQVLPVRQSLLYVIDNDPQGQAGLDALVSGVLDRETMAWKLLRPGRNLGFGAGHNLSLREGTGDYHLVLNPDVELAEDALWQGCHFLREHPHVGLLSPSANGPEGRRQYLGKNYPAIFDLFLRGFAPGWLRNAFAQRMARYELREEVEAGFARRLDIASGCFMLFRGETFRRLKGFDPAFFLYFEDFDLSLRTSSLASVAYVPQVRIVHAGGDAARKGWRHIVLFAKSAFRFYHKHGWRWL